MLEKVECKEIKKRRNRRRGSKKIPRGRCGLTRNNEIFFCHSFCSFWKKD